MGTSSLNASLATGGKAVCLSFRERALGSAVVFCSYDPFQELLYPLYDANPSDTSEHCSHVQHDPSLNTRDAVFGAISKNDLVLSLLYKQPTWGSPLRASMGSFSARIPAV